MAASQGTPLAARNGLQNRMLPHKGAEEKLEEEPKRKGLLPKTQEKKKNGRLYSFNKASKEEEEDFIMSKNTIFFNKLTKKKSKFLDAYFMLHLKNAFINLLQKKTKNIQKNFMLSFYFSEIQPELFCKDL